jgi:hypothetical protein
MVLVDHLEAHVRLIPVLIGWLGSRAMVAAAPSPWTADRSAGVWLHGAGERDRGPDTRDAVMGS